MFAKFDFDIMKTLGEMLNNFLLTLPKFIGAVLIFLVGMIIARIIARVVKNLLAKVGIDKLAERINEIDIVSKSNLKIVPSVILSKTAYYLLVFIFTLVATDVLDMPAVSELMTRILNYIPVLFSALLVLVIGLLVADVLRNLVLTACKSLGIPAAGLIANIVFYFIFLNIIMITLTQAQINTEFIQDNLSIILAGVVFAFAIGYGLASKDILANFLSSFYNKNKFNLGDTIEIDGDEGVVTGMDSTSITLESVDSEIIIPLSKINTNKIIIKKK